MPYEIGGSGTGQRRIPMLPGVHSAMDETDEKEAGRRSLIAVAVFLGILVPLVVVVGIVLQGPGATSVHSRFGLPERVHVCGRDYRGPAREQTLAAIRADGIEPVLVDTGVLASCPVGACTAVALPTACSTVVYVRVGDNAYVSYELLGGP